MNSKDLYNAISKVDDDILERSEAATNNHKNKNSYLKWGTIAACLCLAIGGGILWKIESQTNPGVMPTLPIQNNTYEAMGFEGVLCYDMDEIDNGNPWSNDMIFTTLPVFENHAFNSSGEPTGLEESAVLDRLNAACTALGLENVNREYERNGESVISITAKSESVTVKAEANGVITVNFENGLMLPESLHFTSYDTSREEAEKVMEYFSKQFSKLISFEEPKTVISGIYSMQNDYDQKGNYITEAQFERTYMLYDGAEDEAKNLLNYNMHFVQFYPDEEGRLSIIRINDALSCADKLDDYPIITPEEARDSLLNGNYITSVPYAIEDETLISKEELVYRSSALDKTLMPYYRFYVELPEEGKQTGISTFGAYYVPAIKPEYISNITLWDGSNN